MANARSKSHEKVRYVTYNNEIASVHRGRDLAVVGAMADELDVTSGLSVLGVFCRSFPPGNHRDNLSYASNQIVPLNRVCQLDCAAIACRCDFGEVRHCCFCP